MRKKHKLRVGIFDIYHWSCCRNVWLEIKSFKNYKDSNSQEAFKSFIALLAYKAFAMKTSNVQETRESNLMLPPLLGCVEHDWTLQRKHGKVGRRHVR